MLIIGLAGLQGTGKDTVANYLVREYGFIKFAFSDALYREVQEAYGLEDQSLLRDRATKEVPNERLCTYYCKEHGFRHLVSGLLSKGVPFAERTNPLETYLSPRQVLQWWGTDYRRAQDPDYWVLKTGEWLADQRSRGYPEHRPQFFVECGTRFENERGWIKGFEGQIWHIRRDGIADTTGHVSAQPLPILPGERVLWNNDTIARLHHGIDLMFRFHTPEVRVEPMLPHDSKTGELHETL